MTPRRGALWGGAVVLLSLGLIGRVATASDITGDWRVEVKYDDRFVVVSGGYDCAFKVESEQHFTGTCPEVTVTGDVTGNRSVGR